MFATDAVRKSSQLVIYLSNTKKLGCKQMTQ